MAIMVKCPNPACGKELQAPDRCEGKKARCPHCKQSFVVPHQALVLKEEFSIVTEEEEADRLAKPAASQQAKPVEGQDETCEKCGHAFPKDAIFCPLCGARSRFWKNPARSGLPRTEAEIRKEKLAGDCLKCLPYVGSCVRSVLKLTIYAAILNTILVLLSIFALPLTIFIGGFLVSVATSLVLGGYFLRYFLDVLYNSVGKVDEPPDVPGFKLKELFMTGLKGWGILVVYILPIVTLPLLPFGLLALAVADDGRAYDLRWAFVQAWRSRNPLAVLWGMMILWTLLAAALAVVVYLPFHFAMAYFETADIAGRFIQLGLAILRGMGLVAVGGLWMTAIFRCAGIMGRHFPAIVESLPEKENPFASLGWLFAGVMLSLASLQWAIAPALKALASLPP